MKSKKLLAALLAVSTFLMYGCGNTETDTANTNQTDSTNTENVPVTDIDSSATDSVNASVAADAIDSLFNSNLSLSQNVNASVVSSDPFTYNADGSVTINNASYVMIYNPLIYDEDSEDGTILTRNTLSTGDMSDQIVIPGNRAGLVADSSYIGATVSVRDFDIFGQPGEEIENEGNRAGAMDPMHKVGEKFSFFHINPAWTEMTESEFVCLYEGENCYIWSNNNNVNSDAAKEFADAFDTEIYEQTVSAFGPARFTENGGKVNILFEIIDSDMLCGYFSKNDLYSREEYGSYNPRDYYRNTDHAIIHINSNLLKSSMLNVKATLAHEFQHLICRSDVFVYYGTPSLDVWLDESMSAYAETLTYPDVVEVTEKNAYFCISDLYRNGQSLYNFYNEGNDIGCYGAVYLYSKYLSELLGEDFSADIHEYWRNSYSEDVTEAETLYNIAGSSIVKSFNDAYVYGSDLDKQFNNEYEIFMSKLTMDFYLTTLDAGFSDLAEYADGVHLNYLYNTLEPAKIEGGGRIIIATEGGSYTIPKDSDKNLVYFALDENFDIISGYIYQ